MVPNDNADEEIVTVASSPAKKRSYSPKPVKKTTKRFTKKQN
jgi:hypothetical protein